MGQGMKSVQPRADCPAPASTAILLGPLPTRPSSAGYRLAFAPRRRDALAFRGPHAGAFPNRRCGMRIAPPKDSS